MPAAPLLPLLLLAPVLVAAALSDLRDMRIPNGLSLIALALFLLCLPFVGLAEAGLRAAVAAAVFALGFVGFALRLIGGGDAKFLAAVTLFIPVETLALFALVLAAALVLGVLAVLGLRASPWAEAATWRAARPGDSFPMGLSIALAGLAHPAVVVALQ